MVMVSVPWRYAVHAHLVRPDLANQDVKTLTKRLTPTLGIYVVGILVGLILPIVAVFGDLALALYILTPFSAIRRRSRPAWVIPSGGPHIPVASVVWNELGDEHHAVRMMRRRRVVRDARARD